MIDISPIVSRLFAPFPLLTGSRRPLLLVRDSVGAIRDLWQNAKDDIKSLKYKVKSTDWVIRNFKEKFKKDWIEYLVGLFDESYLTRK